MGERDARLCPLFYRREGGFCGRDSCCGLGMLLLVRVACGLELPVIKGEEQIACCDRGTIRSNKAESCLTADITAKLDDITAFDHALLHNGAVEPRSKRG